MSISPPPVLKSKRSKSPLPVWLILLFVGIFGFPPACMTYMMLLPPVGEDRYAKDATETRASIKDLGIGGFVLSERRGALVANSDAGEKNLSQVERGWRIQNMAGPNEAGLIALLEIGELVKSYRFRLLNFRDGSLHV